MDKLLERILGGELFFDSPAFFCKRRLADMKSVSIAIYGLGECAHWFHEIGMKRYGISPIVALDRNPPSETWYGVKTKTPDEFVKSSKALKEISVIVCIGSRDKFDSIRESLMSFGFEKIHFLHDFYEIHSFYVNNPVDVSNRMKKKPESFSAAFSLLSDELSRDIFLRLVQTHVTMSPVDIPKSPRDEQYFPSDIPLKKGYQTYVCCGAYDGENVRRLHQMIGKTNTILCFEPEPLIYPRLLTCAKQNTNRVADNIICFQDAVFDRDGNFPFIFGDGLGSRLDSRGTSLAKCVKLDSALVAFKPSFISMDIEGAEVAALKGGKETIKRHLPDLGICVYHYPDQIAEVINTIRSIDSSYGFYVRNYTSYLAETVVYATLN